MKVGIVLLLFFAGNARALVPVEGIILGEANPELQIDPLTLVFTENKTSELPIEAARVKNYQRLYQDGMKLSDSCSALRPSRYASVFAQNQARRSMTAALQLYGLDVAIKSVGAYAKKLELSEESYQKLTTNLVRNYCSKNVSVMSVRSIEKALDFYYKNPATFVVPSLVQSPFASEASKSITERPIARSREFDQAIASFRSFCSWGGAVEDYRMLPAYLRNPFIMAQVFGKLVEKQTDDMPRGKVICRELICRPVGESAFTTQFPLSIGSTGIETDLQKQYCYHFRNLDYNPRETVAGVREWMKKTELETPIFETNFFLSVLSGVPDLWFGLTKYTDAQVIAKSSVDDRWNSWAKNVLANFADELYFEESLRVKAIPRRNPADLAVNGFKVDFHVTVGEIDRLLAEDKVSLQFTLKLPKNYLRSLRTRWNDIARRLASEEQAAFFTDNARTIASYLKPKEKLFQQKMWNDDFARLVSTELLAQVLRYEGSMFENYKEEMISVPVRFSYGLFALNYMNYRADVNKGRLKAKY